MPEDQNNKTQNDKTRKDRIRDYSKPLVVYRRLISYARPYWKAFVVAVLAMIFFASTDTGFAALMKPMLDGSFVDKDPGVIRLIPLALIALFVIRGVTGFLSTYCMRWVGRLIIKDLRREMFAHLLNLPTSYYDNTSSGLLISKLTFDVEQVAEAATQAITVIIRDTLTILGLLAWMFYLNWVLALTFVVVGPFIALLVYYVNKRFRKISRSIQNSMGSVTHISEEVIEGHRVVKTFGGHKAEARNFEGANEFNRHQHMKMVTTSAASVPIIQFIAACALAGVVFLATLDSMLAKITVGTFMSFIIAMMMLLPPIKRLTTVNSSLQRGIAAGQSIFSLLAEAPEQDTGDITLSSVKGDLEYKHVSFCYDINKGMVFEDISFQVKPGQSLAIVGRSGTGKTTLVGLLPRFYNLTGGSIFLDGIDINDMKLDDLRSHIALVSQDVTLFNDTVARNIAYGQMSDASEQEIVKAAKTAHALEFIQELPEGFDTMVGENGVLLSGGQRQRLAIARALLKNAPILILDEATSSLDTESERYIQAGLDQLMRNRTTLVIAHRLSTIEKADRIIVLDSGKIVESGTHKELLAKNGHYAHLHHMQFSEQTEKKDIPVVS